MRCFFQGLSSPSGSEERTANEGRLFLLHRPISLHFETAGSCLFWMGSARNKHWVSCLENSRSANLPCDFRIFHQLLSGNVLCAGTSALGLLETKLFLVFSRVSFQPNTAQAGANKSLRENNKTERGTFFYRTIFLATPECYCITLTEDATHSRNTWTLLFHSEFLQR